MIKLVVLEVLPFHGDDVRRCHHFWALLHYLVKHESRDEAESKHTQFNQSTKKWAKMASQIKEAYGDIIHAIN